MEKIKGFSLEDEYLFELNREFDYNYEEVYKLIKDAKLYSSSFDEKIEYIINYDKSKSCSRKALELILDKEINSNNKIDINLINEYLNLIKDYDFKKQKLKEFEMGDYIYKEIFIAKLAEIEIDRLERNLIKIEEIDKYKKYIHITLNKAEKLSEKNKIKVYMSFIYEQISRIYKLERGEINNIKYIEYKNKAQKMRKEADDNEEFENIKCGINKFKKEFGNILNSGVRKIKSREIYADIKDTLEKSTK